MLLFHRRPRLAVLLGAASLSAAGVAWAGPAPPFAALLAQARANSPRLAVAEAEIDQAQGLARQAGARPNPVIGLEVENFAGSGPYSGFEFSETTASVSQTLELGGKRSARVEAGRAALTAAQARGAAARAEFASQLAVAYAEAEAAAAKVAQAEETLAAAESDARTARELVDAGREAELRALQAAAERDAALAEREEAVASRTAAFLRLSTLAGVADVYDSVGESLLSRPVSDVDAGPPESPGVLAARAERDAASARVRVEGRKGVPDVTVSAGLRRFAGDDATAVVAGVSVPLPLFDKNRGATQAARAEVSGAEARLRQAELEATADLRSAQAQARSAQARVVAASAGETAASEAYRLARIGYEAGRIPLVEVTNARRALAAARVRTLDARLAQVRAEADIARLTGRTPFGG